MNRDAKGCGNNNRKPYRLHKANSSRNLNTKSKLKFGNTGINELVKLNK